MKILTMKILSAISIILFTVFGLLMSYTDIRYKKAYNKFVVFFMPIGVAIQVLSILLSNEYFSQIVLNLTLISLISILFYVFRVWAAGDAKVTIVMMLLISYNIYGKQKLIPALYIIGFTFTIALIYILIDSIYLCACDIRKKAVISVKDFFPSLTSETIISCVMLYVTVDSSDQLISSIQWDGINNPLVFALFNIFLIAFISSLVKTKTQKLYLLIFSLALRILLLIFVTTSISSLFNIFLVIIAQIARQFVNRYNNITISTSEIKAGDVLTRESLIFMLPSKVNGLPKYTDETTKCRISDSEAEAVKRWETSKYGQPQIRIVRTIPFVPFIFLGFATSILFLNIYGAY